MSREMLEQYQEMISKNSFATYNHVRFTDLDKDSADAEMDIFPESTNPFGMIHGAAFFTLADVTAGMAARSNGEIFVTQTADLHFLGNEKTDRIFCHCGVLKRTRSTALVEARVTNRDGKLLFLADFTFFNMDGRMSLKKA